MDMTKESFPSPLSNPFRARGFNVLAIDGPGQGISNLRKIRVTHDNYERAASSAIDYLVSRPEVDSDRVVVVGSSFGSHWGQRIAARDSRVRALATNHAVYGDKRLIFEESSPRFKQVFMYMAGIEDEREFDELAAQLTTTGYGAKITCPSLMVMGEYDPLCYLEAGLDLFHELGGPAELWVLESEFHRVAGSPCLGGLDAYPYMADWLCDALAERIPPDHRKLVVISQTDGAGPYSQPVSSPYVPERYS
jgi:dipeptidyl aminopeptidase/acylaminoacyl peptidase